MRPAAAVSATLLVIAIAITADGKIAYVVSYYSGTVTPIRTATNTPENPIKVGRGPAAIAIKP